MSDDVIDVDGQIQELIERIDDVRHRGLIATSWRLSRELKRLAKLERRVIPYLSANFYLMNDAQALHDPESGKEVALESIALLESEELARQYQPDFPEDEYRHTVAWMSTCGYDNLAKHVAETEGYNSDGMHDCINDGLQVCRRTGKMECTTCFREYAGDVYRASDDLDMAIHYARAGFTQESREGKMDRRWVGGKDLVQLLMLTGDLNGAIDTLLQACAFIDVYHNPHDARLTAEVTLESLLCLAGRETEWPRLREQVIPTGLDVAQPPSGENPSHELDVLFRDVVIATCRRDFAAAIELLKRVDRLMLSRQCHATWFEVRLRLIALLLLAGNQTQAQALGKQLEAKAKPARDWLTLRRLKQLLSGEVPPSPIAAANPFSIGPFAMNDSDSESTETLDATQSNNLTEDSAKSVTAEASSSPLESRLLELQQACQTAETDEQVASLFQEIMVIDPNSVNSATDVGRLIYLAHLLSSRLQRSLEAWRWAEPFIERFGHDATALNMLATLAWMARSELADDTDIDEADAVVTLEQIEKWYRASLDLNPDQPRNHSRAGFFFSHINREGEAERCWARSFRLNRSDSHVALQLANVYAMTDRRSDGLAVLDMCIREGGNDPNLFWEAGLAALALERWELAITYLDRFEKSSPAAWSQYYRALALIELHRPADALAALAMEAARSPDQPFGVAVLRAKASADLKDIPGLTSWLTECLARPLSNIDYLSENGFVRLFEKLIAAVQVLPDEDAWRRRIEDLAIQAGMMPDSFFEQTRKARATIEEINFYVVEIRQPLDDRWAAHPGLLFNQKNWTAYIARWGVLASDEEAALQFALEAQSRCFPLTGEVIAAALQAEGFTDSPGIVWQSRHEELPVNA